MFTDMTGNEKAIDLGLYVKSSLTYFLNIYDAL